MKVLHVIIGLESGGAELMLKRLVEYQSTENMNEHIVVSLTGLGDVGIQLKKNNIKVYSLGLSNVFNLFFVLIRLSTVIKRESPDVVQTWMYHADLLGGIVAKALSTKKIIWTVRSTEISKGGAKKTLIIRWLCAKLSVFIPNVIIYAAEKSYINHVAYGYKCNRQTVIPNGFITETPLISKDKNLINLDGRNIIIGFVGRFNRVKGADLLIKSASIVCKKYDSVVFLMVGRGMVDENKILADWIREENLEDNFLLLGERRDIPYVMSLMDIFCSSSRTEGFSNVIVEAMLMKIPCVVTDVGDSKLIIDECGIVVETENYKALSDGILKMIRMPKSDKDKMTSKGYDRITNNYSMYRCSKSFNEIYIE